MSKAGPVTRGLRLPRWGPKTSLFQVREPAFWGFALLLLVGGAYMLLFQLELFLGDPGGWTFSWLLLMLYLLPMFLVIYFLDFYDREPLSVVFGALLWGALVATTLSLVGNGEWVQVVARLGGPDFAADWAPALAPPFVEEIIKALGVVVLYLIVREEIDDIMDGFVYGAMIGLGFSVVEHVLYLVGDFGGGPEGAVRGFLIRVVGTGLYGHSLFTGLAGMGLAYFFTRRQEASLGKRTLVASGLFLLAVGGHFLWNSPLLQIIPADASNGLVLVLLPVQFALKGMPFLLFLVFLIRLAHNRERYWLRKSVESETDEVGITREEAPVLLDAKRRRLARQQLLRQAGPQAAARLKRLHKEQVKLAMVRTRVHDRHHPDMVRQRQLCQWLRYEVGRLTELARQQRWNSPGGGSGWPPARGQPNAWQQPPSYR